MTPETSRADRVLVWLMLAGLVLGGLATTVVAFTAEGVLSGLSATEADGHDAMEGMPHDAPDEGDAHMPDDGQADMPAGHDMAMPSHTAPPSDGHDMMMPS